MVAALSAVAASAAKFDSASETRLLQKVKADKAEIAEAERQIVELQDAVRSGRGQLNQLESDLTEANDPQKQKYQAQRRRAQPRESKRRGATAACR